MKTNKKTILISWFIGVGFGLFLSGIILSILMYMSNKKEIKPIKNTEDIHMPEREEQGDQELPESLETEEQNEVQEMQPTQELAEVENEINKETIELDIKNSATAKEITKMLVENGIISDYDEFIAYIVKMDAERSLSHGTKTFPLNSDVETVFKILRPYN